MTVSEQPNPERSHPVGLSTPSTSWGSRTGTVLKVEHSKTLPPGPPLRAREVFANRFTEAESTGDTRRALQVCRRPLPTGVHTGESTSKPRPRARSASSLPPAPARSVRRAGRDHRKESSKEKGKRGEGSEAEREDPEGAAMAPSLPGRRRQRKGARGQGRECVVRSAPGPGEAPLPLRALPEAALRCGAGARRGRAAGLHGPATFFTVTALREHNSSRPRSETARAHAPSKGRAPRGASAERLRHRLVGTGHDGPQHRGGHGPTLSPEHRGIRARGDWAHDTGSSAGCGHCGPSPGSKGPDGPGQRTVPPVPSKTVPAGEGAQLLPVAAGRGARPQPCVWPSSWIKAKPTAVAGAGSPPTGTLSEVSAPKPGAAGHGEILCPHLLLPACAGMCSLALAGSSAHP